MSNNTNPTISEEAVRVFVAAESKHFEAAEKLREATDELVKFLLAIYRTEAEAKQSESFIRNMFVACLPAGKKELYAFYLEKANSKKLSPAEKAKRDKAYLVKRQIDRLWKKLIDAAYHPPAEQYEADDEAGDDESESDAESDDDSDSSEVSAPKKRKAKKGAQNSKKAKATAPAPEQAATAAPAKQPTRRSARVAAVEEQRVDASTPEDGQSTFVPPPTPLQNDPNLPVPPERIVPRAVSAPLIGPFAVTPAAERAAAGAPTKPNPPHGGKSACGNEHCFDNPATG